MIVLIGWLAGCDTADAVEKPDPSVDPSVTPSVTWSAAPSSGPKPVIRFPVEGGGTWRVAAGSREVAGRSGQLMRYRVAVEKDISGVDVDAFAAQVSGVLADPRSWTGRGRWRFQRVGPGQPHHFVIYLATPATRDELCAMGYDRYTSCRNGNRIVLNVARWTHGVPRYGASLDTYRAYLVNHEVGHRLGHGHERCPGRGRLARVMQQQTLGLRGCVANPWPYP